MTRWREWLAVGIVGLVACKGGDKKSGEASGSAAKATGSSAAMPALKPLPPPPAGDVTKETAENALPRYEMKSGPWGSILVNKSWIDDTAPGGFVNIHADDPAWPAEAIHVKKVQRKPGETVESIVKSAELPKGYTAVESVRTDAPYGLDGAGAETAFLKITSGTGDNVREGEIDGWGRGDTVYLVTCYAMPAPNGGACFRASWSFRPPAGG